MTQKDEPGSPPGTATLSKADYETLAEFRYLLRRFLAFSETVARDAGLSAQQHQALLAIKGFPGRDRVTISELAERLAIAHHSAVGLVDRLVEAGLAVRQAGDDDRRKVLVQLTPAAGTLLESLSATHRRELKSLAPLLQSLLTRLQ